MNACNIRLKWRYFRFFFLKTGRIIVIAVIKKKNAYESKINVYSASKSKLSNNPREAAVEIL